MISIRMPLDIRPHCDCHPSIQMDLVFMQLVAGVDQPWQPAFVCSKANCPRHYNPSIGYFNPFKQRIDPDRVARIPCPHDGLPMYVAGQQGDAPHLLLLWRCAQHGCNGSAVIGSDAATAAW